jgi:peptidoglycan/xylan/chitin deacetylase (PgdA/CDA1 family)
MARGWKRVAELVVTRSGATGLLERRARPSTVVLAYHNIVPRGETAIGDLSLHIDQETFSDQLDFLLEGREVVELETALCSGPSAGNGHRTQLVVTFDDAYAGTMSAGLHELTKRGLPSTVFVPPGLLGSPGFWWDRLAGKDGLDPRIRATALNVHQGRTEAVMRWAETEGLEIQDMPAHVRPVGPESLQGAALPANVTLGAHTWNHPNLTALGRADMDDEMGRSREWLIASTDRYVDWITYPYGLHNDHVVTAAEQHFQGALRVTGGSAIRRGVVAEAPHRVPRLNVPRGLSLEGLALRVAGILA